VVIKKKVDIKFRVHESARLISGTLKSFNNVIVY